MRSVAGVADLPSPSPRSLVVWTPEVRTLHTAHCQTSLTPLVVTMCSRNFDSSLSRPHRPLALQRQRQSRCVPSSLSFHHLLHHPPPSPPTDTHSHPPPAVVTGGGTGVGAMFASAYVQNGATVYIAARKEGRLREVADALNRKGPGRCEWVVADLSVRFVSLLPLCVYLRVNDG